MFYKIFRYVLLLTYVCTYTFKSIKNNNYTNFQKLPNPFNFESKGIQTVKPNLESFLSEEYLRYNIWFISLNSI